ncbi:MAG: hypothetical protein ACU0BS_13490 [Hasllibacter sp.]
MTMIADIGPAAPIRTAPGGPARPRPAEPHKVTPMAWGYVIEAPVVEDRGHPALRAVATVCGAAVLIASGGLWLAPGAMPTLEALPMTLASSVALLMLGAWLMTLGRERGALEAQIDHRRAEVRVMRRMRSGSARLLARHGFAALGEIAVEGDSVHLSTRDGARLGRWQLGA